jgi:hypothetical protein
MFSQSAITQACRVTAQQTFLTIHTKLSGGPPSKHMGPTELTHQQAAMQALKALGLLRSNARGVALEYHQ